MAAKLAVGYTLDQIANDITQKTPASFEPSIDYVVTKVPKFNFEKFPGGCGVGVGWVWGCLNCQLTECWMLFAKG